MRLTRSAGSSPARQRDDAQAQRRVAAQRDARGAQHRLLAGVVGVEREPHLGREALQLGDLVVGQRRAHDPDAVAHADLVHRDDVGVALGRDDEPGLRRGGAREVGGEELAALVEELALGAVDVLRPPVVRVAERAAREAAHAPARVGEREHDLRAEAVVDLAAALRCAARGPAS